MLGMGINTSYGAHLHALRLIKMADAFRAFVRMNFVELSAHVDRFVGAFGLTHIAIDAFFGDAQRHDEPSFFASGLQLGAMRVFQRLRHRWADQAAHIAAKLADLAHERGADALHLGCRQEKNSVNA
jgi:hypothetical protein